MSRLCCVAMGGVDLCVGDVCDVVRTLKLVVVVVRWVEMGCWAAMVSDGFEVSEVVFFFNLGAVVMGFLRWFFLQSGCDGDGHLGD